MKKPPNVRRCNFFSQPLFRSEDDWIEENNHKLFHVVASVARDSCKRTEKKTLAFYETFMKTFSKQTKGIKSFYSMHSIGIMSKLGLLPYEFSFLATMEPNKRTVSWFRDHFKLASGLSTAVDCNRLLSTMSTRYGITKSTAENLLCKGYRICKNIIPNLK